jgi:hypothetical protein
LPPCFPPCTSALILCIRSRADLKALSRIVLRSDQSVRGGVLVVDILRICPFSSSQARTGESLNPEFSASPINSPRSELNEFVHHPMSTDRVNPPSSVRCARGILAARNAPQLSGQVPPASYMSSGSDTHKEGLVGPATLPPVIYHAKLFLAYPLAHAEFLALLSYCRAELRATGTL